MRSRSIVTVASTALLLGFGVLCFAPWHSERVPPSEQGVSARRAALLGAVSAATVAGLQEEKAEAFGKNPSDWLGYYKDWDPQHPMCPRKIKYDPAVKTGMIVEGGDGNPGCEKKVLTPFRAPVTFTPDSDSITIDFTSKGGPADRGPKGDVVGKWENDGIVFPDAWYPRL
eukprot:s2833_g5.t1